MLSSWWECLSKTWISYRQGLGPSQLPLRHIGSLYTPIRRFHSPRREAEEDWGDPSYSEKLKWVVLTLKAMTIMTC